MTAEKDTDHLEKGAVGAVTVREGEKPGPPDGGTKAWLTVFGSFFANMCSFGWSNCLGVFQAEYERDLLKDYGTSEVAWIASTQCKCIPSILYNTDQVFSFLHVCLLASQRVAL